MNKPPLLLRLKQALQTIYSGFTPYGNFVREAFAGGWQRNMEQASCEDVMAFSAVYSCVSLISNDIAKLRLKMMQQDADNGTWEEVTQKTTIFLKVLRKPNRYQTRLQFVSQWMTYKLLFGNVYVLKEREGGLRGIVRALYLLDPRQVSPMVAEDGEVFYRVNKTTLGGVADSVVVPASEIIHDRMITPWHPLVGVTPIYACAMSAVQGLNIQKNSSKFFANMSMPGGQLTSPHTIDDITATRLKTHFEQNFSGGGLGRLLVAGDGLKYEPISIPAADAQLIEQLRWTVEDVARCFGVPLYKVMSLTGSTPLATLSALNQEYYNQCLQVHIESIELLLNEGLELPVKYEIEMDLDGLLRMDPLSQAVALKDGISGGWLTPNEARKRQNLKSVTGGESPYLQEQNYSLAALAKRDALDNPFGAKGTSGSAPDTGVDTAEPAAAPTPALPPPKALGPTAKELAESLIVKFTKLAREEVEG